MKTTKKLVNLQKALKECGVNTTLTVDDDGEFFLTGTLWNCTNGNEEPFCFYTEDDEIVSYTDPKTDSDNFMARLMSL